MITKDQLEKDFSALLLRKFKGKKVRIKYNQITINSWDFIKGGIYKVKDARITFSEYNWCDEGGGGTHDNYLIELLCETLKGNAGRWIKYSL